MIKFIIVCAAIMTVAAIGFFVLLWLMSKGQR